MNGPQDQHVDISCSGLGHEYLRPGGTIRVLKNIDLNIKPGTLCVLVGPSGCGKSTLLRLMLGLEEPTEGTVTVDKTRKQEGIAYVPQNAMLLPWRTALQNASLGIEIKEHPTAANRNFLLGRFGTYGLRGFEDSLWGDLSGGMRQQVAIICALASNPRILMCDEPFSAIDFVSRLQLLNQFKEDCSLLGVTTVFVTHNIEEAIFLGDVIYVLSARPGSIKAIHPNLVFKNSFNSVKVRETPEFQEMFRRVWNDLKGTEDHI